MRRRLSALSDALLPRRPDTDLRVRYYQALCLLAGALVTFVIVPVNIAQGVPAYASVASLIFGANAVGLYAASRRGRVYPAAAWLSLMAILTINWGPNAGSRGGTPFYFLAAAMSAVAFFAGWRRWAAVAGVLSTVLALVWLEQVFPGWATPFATDRDRTLEFLSGLFGSLVAIVLMAWLFFEVYQRDRARLQVTADALASSQAQFAAIFQHNPEAVMLLDASEGLLQEVNETFERLTGWSRREAIGKTTADIGLWVDPDARRQLYERIAVERSLRGYLGRLRHRGGRAFWASISASEVEIGGRRCRLATLRDVSAQIDAQRALAESRVMLSTFINSTSDLLWMVQPDSFALTICNDAFARHVQEETGGTVAGGMTPEDISAPEVAARWRALYRRALLEGPFTTEYEASGRTLLLSFHVVRHETTVLGVSAFARDITPLKQAEEERDRMQLQFLQAQKMESLGSLAGGVAHDFNNMLGGIMGYADLLLAGEADQTRREHLRAIVRAATRSSDLTRKLLAFARRGKNVIEAVDLNLAVRESMAMLAPSLRPDVAVTFDLRATSTIDGDPSQLHQAIVNLCINAHDAMPDGGTLGVATRGVEIGDAAAGGLDVAPGPYVELRVIDTGLGMTDQVRQRIFEPFFTTKPGGELSGTGLGLSTVYGVTHLHRGAIRVDTAPGRGTTFTLLLPRGTLVPATGEPAPSAASGEGLILVVEDEDMLRKLATTALARLGYRTLTAADGAEGVDLFRRHHRELSGVLLDLKMPRKTGREAFLEMHAIDPRVPVLLCSGYGENEEAQDLISRGATGLLSKPYRIGELAAQVGRFAR